MDFFEIVLFSIGPVFSLIGASKGYKTFIKYEIFTNLILGLVLTIKPQLIYSLLVNLTLF